MAKTPDVETCGRCGHPKAEHVLVSTDVPEVYALICPTALFLTDPLQETEDEPVPAVIACAACGTALPDDLKAIDGLVVCPQCLRTVVKATGALASGLDTVALSSEQAAALIALRKTARQARGV